MVDDRIIDIFSKRNYPLDKGDTRYGMRWRQAGAGGYAMSGPVDILTAALGAEHARDALEALSAAGWVVVPRIPTQAMLDAGWYPAHDEDAAGVWEEMIDAAS